MRQPLGQSPHGHLSFLRSCVIATSVIFIVLGIVAVFLRWFVRRDRKVGLGADDWLIVVALVWNLAGAFYKSDNL